MVKIKKKCQRRSDQRDLCLTFHSKTGVLSIEIRGLALGFKNKAVTFVVNEEDHNVDIDGDGKGKLEFQRSDPPELYTVRVKNKGRLTDDQRLGFTY